MRSFKELFDKDGPIMGTWSQITSPDVIEILGRSGFDFTIIDMLEFSKKSTGHFYRNVRQ